MYHSKTIPISPKVLRLVMDKFLAATVSYVGQNQKTDRTGAAFNANNAPDMLLAIKLKDVLAEMTQSKTGIDSIAKLNKANNDIHMRLMSAELDFDDDVYTGEEGGAEDILLSQIGDKYEPASGKAAHQQSDYLAAAKTAISNFTKATATSFIRGVSNPSGAVTEENMKPFLDYADRCIERVELEGDAPKGNIVSLWGRKRDPQ